MTERALELLQLPPGEPCLLLDVGCGSGVSSKVLHDLGHTWVGTDLSADMLRLATAEDGAVDDDSNAEDDEAAVDTDEPEEIDDEDDETNVLIDTLGTK